MMNLLLFMFVLLPTFREVPAEYCTNNQKAKLYEKGDMTTEVQDVILDYHNQLRDQVSSGSQPGADGTLPSASNMQVMVWDEGLARDAQAHANFCKFKHFDPADPNGYPKTALPWGQNIFEAVGTDQDSVKMNWTRAMESWSKESGKFDTSLVENYQGGGPMTGHFTQMIWAKTNRIGCGYTLGSSTDEEYVNTKFSYTGYFTCNYLEAGNMYSEDSTIKIPIYKEGHPCKDCEECDSTYTSLCKSP